MNETLPEVQVAVSNEPQALDAALKRLWEKIRNAGEMLRALRQEKKELSDRLAALERELDALRSESIVREQEMKRLRAERAQLLQADANVRFTDEEKEILKGRIRDLIAKINSHL